MKKQQHFDKPARSPSWDIQLVEVHGTTQRARCRRGPAASPSIRASLQNLARAHGNGFGAIGTSLRRDTVGVEPWMSPGIEAIEVRQPGWRRGADVRCGG